MCRGWCMCVCFKGKITLFINSQLLSGELIVSLSLPQIAKWCGQFQQNLSNNGASEYEKGSICMLRKTRKLPFTPVLEAKNDQKTTQLRLRILSRHGMLSVCWKRAPYSSLVSGWGNGCLAGTLDKSIPASRWEYCKILLQGPSSCFWKSIILAAEILATEIHFNN